MSCNSKAAADKTLMSGEGRSMQRGCEGQEGAVKADDCVPGGMGQTQPCTVFITSPSGISMRQVL